MKEFTQNGVVFNKYRESSEGQAIGVAPILVSGQEGVDAEFGGIINAVDIDWNGVEVDDIRDHDISTTGQLINYIKGAYSSGNQFNDTQKQLLLALINSNSEGKTPLQVLQEQITSLSDKITALSGQMTTLLGQVTDLSDRVDTLEGESSLSDKTITWDPSRKELVFTNNDDSTVAYRVPVVTGVRKTTTDNFNPGQIELDLQDKLDKNKVKYNSEGTLTIDLS